MASIRFSIRMDLAIKARLDREARREDRSAAYVAQKAIDSYLQRQETLQCLVVNAEAAAESGPLISGDAMHAWIASWDSADELPEPQIAMVSAAKSAGKSKSAILPWRWRT